MLVCMCRFGVPHVNVGDLLYAQVAAKTALGQEAQRHMDSSKTVPDTLLMRLLLDRLQQPDCQAVGWVLDGFPHTRKQVGCCSWGRCQGWLYWFQIQKQSAAAATHTIMA